MVVREVDPLVLQKIIKNSPIPILLELCTKHPICEILQEHFSALSKRYNGKIAFLRVDIAKYPEILKVFNVRIPAYVAIDREVVLNIWYNPSPYQLTMIAKELSKIL